MTVDLSTLEAGDKVKYGSSKCTVNFVKKIDAFTWHIILFNNVSHTQTSYHYDCNGYNKCGGVDIVEIIKTPKRWTDDDMKAAYVQGALSGDNSPYSSEWLEQYKPTKIKSK